MGFRIGFDIGGTKIEAKLISFNEKEPKNFIGQFSFQTPQENLSTGYVIHQKRVPTERLLGYENILEKMVKLTQSVCKEAKYKLSDVAGIGLSVPGPVHPQTGIITASNSMVFAGHCVHDDLKKALALDIPILAENDANCFALAEVLCGVGLEYYKKTQIPVRAQNAVGLILGSGFGGGIIHKGRIISGKRGGGGEVGHMTLYPQGHPCYCGRLGCAEQYLCGPALEASMATRMYSQIKQRPGAAEIFELYEAKDPIALAVVKKYKKDLAFFLGSVTCFYDPHYFVCGGGLSLQNVIYENLANEIGRNTYIANESIDIYKHVVGDSAGAIGAALLIHESL